MTIPVKSTPLVCSGHTRPVPSLHFSPLLSSTSTPSNGAGHSTTSPEYFLISSCKDGKPQLRDWLGDWCGTFQGHKGAVWSARLSSDGNTAVTGSADFSAKVWDTNSGACLTTLPHNHIVRTVDLSPGGSGAPLRVLTGGAEKKLRIWDLEHAARDGSETSQIEGVDEFKRPGSNTAHEGTIKSACWDEKRDSVVSMGEDKVVRWWDTRTHQLTHTVTFDAPITSMEKSHDGDLLAVTSGKTVTFLSLDSRLPYKTHQLDYEPSTASLHPIHHEIFVTGSVTDGWVRLHSAETGAELEVGKGHHGPVHCVSFSPDGEMYASGSEDGTIRLWQTVPKDYGLWRYNQG